MKKETENLSHMMPIRSILAAKYGISHLKKLISLVFQQAVSVYDVESTRYIRRVRVSLSVIVAVAQRVLDRKW